MPVESKGEFLELVQYVECFLDGIKVLGVAIEGNVNALATAELLDQLDRVQLHGERAIVQAMQTTLATVLGIAEMEREAIEASCDQSRVNEASAIMRIIATIKSSVDLQALQGRSTSGLSSTARC